MRSSIIFFSVLLMLPVIAMAEVPIVFSDVSAGVFRFQIKLAEQGNAEAQYKVGEMYETGKGSTKDLTQAQDWYEKAAKQGHKKAEYRLLLLDISKNGLTDTSKNQLNILRSEANSGSPDAQYFLGKMYASGVGVPKSLEDAQTWLKKAAFNGVTEAETEAIAVDEELARMQEREAKRKAETAEEARKQREAQDLARKEKEARERELAARREAEKAATARNSQDKVNEQLTKEQAIKLEKDRIEKEKADRVKTAAAEASKKSEPDKAEPAKSEAADEASKATFETDPCKGKSARFLSTCR